MEVIGMIIFQSPLQQLLYALELRRDCENMIGIAKIREKTKTCENLRYIQRISFREVRVFRALSQ